MKLEWIHAVVEQNYSEGLFIAQSEVLDPDGDPHVWRVIVSFGRAYVYQTDWPLLKMYADEHNDLAFFWAGDVVSKAKAWCQEQEDVLTCPKNAP